MEQVLDYLQKNEARFIRELCDYVRFPSVSAQPQHRGDVRACAAWLVKHCRQIGLKAALHPTAGHPIVTARNFDRRSPHRPHFILYGHYDVQPVDPLHLWKNPPFEPRITNGILYARGASDNKGQHFAHLKAVEAFLKTGTPLPCDLTLLFEGEEETGGTSLAGYLRQHWSDLRCDAVIISDNGIPDLEHPALTYALRGIAAMEVRIEGPARDLHSGLFGGSVDNPAMVLCQLLSSLRDRQGRITVPGLYRDVQTLSRFERQAMARVPFSESAYRRFLGVRRLFGEKGYSPVEQRTARPTVEINGLTSGYQGEGTKTIIPAWASAKLTLRLVPNQKPKRVIELVQRYLRKICPPTVRLIITPGHSGDPYWVSPRGPMAKAALNALQQAFGRQPVLLREGGSIPIVNDFKTILGVDTLLLGLSLPDDNAHSPNEKFDLDCFRQGMRLGACLWPKLSACR
jgi:acetylornithine deacetylase/succinyl-diaminopimelate desuccinylase-like protein